MKYPVYWFLISSGLVASTSLSFAQAAQETLTPADANNFSPKETDNAQGTIYTCTGNVCISNIGGTSGLSSSCFNEKQGDLTFIGNGYSLCFENINAGTSKSGAIEVTANKALSISGFSLFSCSFCPPGATGQGAIKSTGTASLNENSSLIFNRNCSTTSGGAFNCGEELKIEGNKQAIFSGNSSSISGGAIYTKKLTLASGGLTVFSNNSVTHASDPKGGAICLNDASSECSLSAELGDIIFDGNKITNTGSSTTTRNSIDLGTSGKFTQLRAKENFGIFFFDPIANKGDAATLLNINQQENTTNYTGKIVFSGERLSDEERKSVDNFKSAFKQPIELKSGSLILKEGVTVTANKVTQTGGTVIMDLGTSLIASTETIELTNLTVNVASLGGGVRSNHSNNSI